YEGPFHVTSSHEKTLKADRHGRVEIVSIDRLKPAHVDDSALPDNSGRNARPIKPTSGILTSTSGSALDTSETSFSHPGQQHVSTAPSTDETSVSRPDQQTTPPLTSDEIAGSRNANETTISSSGRRQRLPVRFRDLPYNQQWIRPCLQPSPFWYRQLQSTMAKGGLIAHALVNALNRYSGIESASHTHGLEPGCYGRFRFLGSTWFRPTSAVFSGPDTYERNLQILDTNHSGMVY
ncbi:unnamed protein product, partial [Schistosoma mattheei]